MRKKIVLFALLLLVSLISLTVYQQTKFNDGKLHVIFCDVGQGDGIYIRTQNGTDIIIDGGPDDSILTCLTDNSPFWDREIELMILTHPHADHMNGLISIAKRYKVHSFISPKITYENDSFELLLNILTTQNTNKKSSCQGDNVKLADSVILATLWPGKCPNGENAEFGSDLNDASIVQLLTYRDFQLLLTGDAGEEIQSQVSALAGDIDVLKIPHHGSATGIDSKTLDSLRPEYSVISAGVKNRYGHPSKEILNILDGKKIKTLRTDRDGEIKIITEGENYLIE